MGEQTRTPIINKRKKGIKKSKKMITIQEITEIVCKVTQTPIDLILSKTRKRVVVIPRQIAQHIAREKTRIGVVKIGEYFDRDHATVLHSSETIHNFLSCRKQTMEGRLYLQCLREVSNYEREHYDISPSNILLTPHQVPTC